MVKMDITAFIMSWSEDSGSLNHVIARGSAPW